MINMYSIVYVTTSSEEESKKIGKAVVKENLAACANTIPHVLSIYRWDNKLCEDRESILFLKTKKDLVPTLIQKVKELHSYEVPAIVEIPLQDGHKDYFLWIEKNTRI